MAVSKVFDLDRFRIAQQTFYATALAEIQSGHKQSHWVWYIFPQIKGLGQSEQSQYYGIESLEEARAFLQDETLRANLLEITNALLSLESNDAEGVMGWPDCLKLQSCMTLFSLAEPSVSVFQKVLKKYFGGETDAKTIELLHCVKP